MMSLSVLRTVALPVAALALVFVAGCQREPEVPPPHVEIPTVVHEQGGPVAVTGCLRAGEADATYVLTTTRDEAGQTVTYELIDGQDQVNLQDHVGHTVEVTGEARPLPEGTRMTQARGPTEPADEVAETPVVETRTELRIQQLNVQTIRHVAPECP